MIPQMEFIDDVAVHMKGKDVTATLHELDERLQKYKFLEINLLQKRARIRRQMPDLEKSIEVIKLLETGTELNSHFLMSSQLYSKARIPPTQTVCLWLGANVMLEYPLEEAKTLLTKNLSTSLGNLKQIDGDLEFLRDQITTSEVNLARIYNWNVKRLQSQKATGGSASSSTTTLPTTMAAAAAKAVSSSSTTKPEDK
uniref:Prefoldin subunit 3 n=1 Tax=Aceria tosichella TaxID=561515 RepID=A0A6G1SQV2_9ACAR